MNDAIEEVPEGEADPLDLEVNYETDEFGIKISTTYGESSIVLEHSWDGAEDAAMLVQVLPQILINVQEALDKETS